METPELFRIDVHHHALPPDMLPLLREHSITQNADWGTGAGSPLVMEPWESASALSVMDTYGIATAILSELGASGLAGNARRQQELARATNRFFAQTIAEAPRRFGAFASLPMPNIDATLDEIAYVFDTLHLDGVFLLSNYDGRYLGDPLFDPVFAELHRRKAVAFLHPAAPREREQSLTLPVFVLDFVFDTTRALTNLILRGTLQRYPEIRLICAHAGGVTPYLGLRLTVSSMIMRQTQSSQEVAQALSSLYYETALSAAPVPLSVLQQVTDLSHLVLGCDSPPAPPPLIGQTIAGIENDDGLTKQAIRMIERENALALFPRLKTL